MKQMLRKKLQQKMANSEGFTLLEILVVLTIMGFLIAMVGPRLAGISGGAVDTVCDSNQNRMITYMASYYENTARFPDHLTNLVITDGAALIGATYQIPVVSDQDPDNGPEVFSNEIYARNHFHIHYLSAAETDTLNTMGINSVFNLNDYTQVDDAALNPGNYDNDVAVVAIAAAERPVMEQVDVDADLTGLGVAMVGTGVDATGVFVAATAERGWGEPDWFGRIVLGMGPECGLITSGVIANAAHCPGGLQNSDNVIYNDYMLVLPRLAATANLMQDAAGVGANIALMDNDGATAGTQLFTISYAEDNEPSAAYVLATNADNYQYREFTIDEAQEDWQFATQCPEGHSYPEDDGDYWAMDLDAGGTIN